MSVYRVNFCGRHFDDVATLAEGRKHLVGFDTLESNCFEKLTVPPMVEKDAHFTIEKDGEVLETYFYNRRHPYQPRANEQGLYYTIIKNNERMNVKTSFMAALSLVPHNFHQIKEPLWQKIWDDECMDFIDLEALDTYRIVEHTGLVLPEYSDHMEGTWKFVKFWEIL